MNYLPDNKSVLAFCIAVSASELRVELVLKNQKQAIWIGNAPPRRTFEFCFYFTRQLEDPPSTDGNPALWHVAYLRLRDGRWLVAFVWLRSLSPTDIVAARDAAIAKAREDGVQVLAEHRIGLFALPIGET
jgi:hypothetical protein